MRLLLLPYISNLLLSTEKFAFDSRIIFSKSFTCHQYLNSNQSSIKMSSDRRYSTNGNKTFNGYQLSKTFLIGKF